MCCRQIALKIRDGFKHMKDSYHFLFKDYGFNMYLPGLCHLMIIDTSQAHSV